MPTAVVDGIATRYQVTGSGPPVLFFSPGGFNASLRNWTDLGIYRRLDLIHHFAKKYTCIIFDRRESGQSGGRIERIAWDHYVAQGLGLLDHLGIDGGHLVGGCAGCSVAISFAARHPERVGGMVLFWPAGGAKYRMAQHARLAQHLVYVDQHGLDGVISLACDTEQSFSQDPRVGPWVTVIRTDPTFAEAYAGQDLNRYRAIVSGMARLLFDRDTVPGAEPEDLLRLDIPTLVVPGHDDSHATSGARYLEECLPQADYWDVPTSEQTEETTPARMLDFLDHI